MKTLVVHPYDESTLELEKVYAGKPVDVLHREDLSRRDVETALFTGHYDRVILLGHGTEYGLYNMRTGKYVFDIGTFRNNVMPRKMEVVAVWCHANIFFIDADNLGNVFYTGMFVSEPKEAVQYGLNATEKEIAAQFRKFSRILNTAAFMPMDEIRPYVEKKYTGKDEVTRFNRECLGFE